MTSLDRKLWRELWGMRSQALAIAMVIASGVGSYVMSLSTLDSLRLTRAIFYRDYRFAQVFASLERAPESLRRRIQDIPGVHLVQTRVVSGVNLDLEDYPDPATALLVSNPSGEEFLLNRLYLRQGRLVDPTRDDEVVASEAFAESHGFQPGDRLAAIINGRKKSLTIVGIALSPEHIYQIGPGAVFPDFESYAILWMAHKPLATAFDMDEAFNDVVLTLSADARTEDVIERLDILLARYGGRGAYARKDQVSHRFLNEEFRQLAQMATVFPAIFLSVAAFLLNVVFSRLFQTQREAVATLKAFGYRNRDIGIHFSKMVLVIVLVGVAGGLALGLWLGHGLSVLYTEFYRLPFLHYRLDPAIVVQAALVTLAASLLGTAYAVRRAATQPPAEAMRPEPPAHYREALVERLGLKRFLSQPTRMIARNIERRPVKALLSSIGIAFSCSILMMGVFFEDAIDYMVDVQFRLVHREDVTVVFVDPTSYRAVYDLMSVPGVEHAELFRSVPVRLSFEHREYRTAIQGITPGGDLMRLLDRELKTVPVPAEGVVLTDYLGTEILGVRPGESVTVEVLEGSRPVRSVPVAGLVTEYTGVSGYMQMDALNRVLREGRAISGAYLATDENYRPQVYRALKEMPRVAGTIVREKAIRSFYETAAEMLLTFASISTLLAATIAFGVVYNSARIALSERSRELASLRVLGLTRGEVSYILLGELAVLTLAAIPIGFLVGQAICGYFVLTLQTDLFRVPLVLERSTYTFSAIVVLICAVISGLIVRRRVNRLDLVAVLKTRE